MLEARQDLNIVRTGTDTDRKQATIELEHLLTNYDNAASLSRVVSSLHPEHIQAAPVHGFGDSASKFYDYI